MLLLCAHLSGALITRLLKGATDETVDTYYGAELEL